MSQAEKKNSNPNINSNLNLYSLASNSRLNQTNLARGSSKNNLVRGSKGNLNGSKNQLAMDSATLIAQALESGQRVYENTYKMKPDKKY